MKTGRAMQREREILTQIMTPIDAIRKKTRNRWTDQRTDGRTNGWPEGPTTDRPSYKDARTHLKMFLEMKTYK